VTGDIEYLSTDDVADRGLTTPGATRRVSAIGHPSGRRDEDDGKARVVHELQR
jgi:hypothetical protein